MNDAVVVFFLMLRECGECDALVGDCVDLVVYVLEVDDPIV